MARTESSRDSVSVTFAISPHMARLTALRILGRLKTTVAMPPSRSTRISSLMLLLLDVPDGVGSGSTPASTVPRIVPDLREAHPDFPPTAPRARISPPLDESPWVRHRIFWDTRRDDDRVAPTRPSRRRRRSQRAAARRG